MVKNLTKNVERQKINVNIFYYRFCFVILFSTISVFSFLLCCVAFQPFPTFQSEKMKFQKKNLRWEETNPRKEEKNPRIKVQIQENGFSDSCSSTFLVFFCFFSYNVYSFLKKKNIRGEEKIKVLEKKKTENGKVKNSLGMQSATVGLSGLFFVLFCSIINSILKRVRHSI